MTLHIFSFLEESLFVLCIFSPSGWLTAWLGPESGTGYCRQTCSPRCRCCLMTQNFYQTDLPKRHSCACCTCVFFLGERQTPAPSLPQPHLSASHPCHLPAPISSLVIPTVGRHTDFTRLILLLRSRHLHFKKGQSCVLHFNFKCLLSE